MRLLVTQQPEGKQLIARATRTPEREQDVESVAAAREPPEGSEPPQPSAGVRCVRWGDTTLELSFLAWNMAGD